LVVQRYLSERSTEKIRAILSRDSLAATWRLDWAILSDVFHLVVAFHLFVIAPTT
jgi:hypothetical protein